MISIWLFGVIVASPVYMRSKFEDVDGGICAINWLNETENLDCGTSLYSSVAVSPPLQDYQPLLNSSNVPIKFFSTTGYDCTCGLDPGRARVSI